MALTSGFFNALNHDRQYEAVQVGSIFDGIIRDGVFATEGQALAVTASGTGLIVNVGTGRAWFDHTWTLNDAILPIEADEAEIVLDRIDALVLEVDASLSGRTNSIKFVKGTPSSTPAKPTLINTEEVHQYALAYVSIKAEQTLIEQQDIENAIGTEATPFVTGILETVDVTMLIAQWQAQFEAMIRDDQQDFTNWEILTKAAYEAWFAGVQAEMEEDMEEFEGWEEATKTEFDSWFQNLQDELDENQAAHLQRQIGNLNALVTSDKNDLVSAINEVNGKITTSVSEILIDYDESMVGVEITLSHTASAEGHTPESYTRTLVEPEPGEAYEIEVDVKNLGEWVISWTHEGQSYTQTLDVHYYGYYHVVLHEGFTWREWVVAGGISILKHDSLASLLADEEDVRRLFLVHNAVDYMVEKGDTRSECSTIINNDLCAKWINLSDYALDYLYTNTSLKSLMDTADKYFYGEWVYDGTSWGPKGNIPVMTSNSAPYGEASSTGSYSGMEPYKAFDGDYTSYWYPTSNAQSGSLYYHFVNPVLFKKYRCVADCGKSGGVDFSYKIHGSNNGVDWTDLSTALTTHVAGNTSISVDLSTNNNYYLYFRMSWSTPIPFNVQNQYSGRINNAQIYGRELKVSVPAMTSNTAPYGEVSAQDYRGTGYEPYKAFNGSSSSETDAWMGISVSTFPVTKWLQYEFTKNVRTEMIMLHFRNNGASQVQFINADTSETVQTYTQTFSANATTCVKVDNPVECKKHRVAITVQSSTAGTLPQVYECQFYGKDYSEKEFANDGSKWLYDHGVELVEMDSNWVSGTVSGTVVSPTKESDQIYFPTNPSIDAGIGTSNKVNISLYNMLFFKDGNKGTYAYNRYGKLVLNPGKTFGDAQHDYATFMFTKMGEIKSLDVSNINQEAFIGMNSGYNNLTYSFTELWLE